MLVLFGIHVGFLHGEAFGSIVVAVLCVWIVDI